MPGKRDSTEAGGTRAAKTTLLAALLALVPQQDRIVVVEDSRELAPNYPHVVRIEGRPANTEVAGAISLTDLVRQSLRMRPDQPTSGGTSEAHCAGPLNPTEWTPRELRHSFVSVLSDAGVPVEEISRLVGHAGTTVTELSIGISCGR